MTSKRQVTLPKAIADRYGIRPGDTLGWMPEGDHLRVEIGGREGPPPLSMQERLRLFDRASLRRDEAAAAAGEPGQPPSVKGPGGTEGPATARGWTREELYDRGRPG